MALIVNCGPGVTATSAYFVLYLSIVDVQLPIVDTPTPFIAGGPTNIWLFTYPTIPNGIVLWSVNQGYTGCPNPNSGIWNNTTIYTGTQTVSCGSLVYENTISANKNNCPQLGGCGSGIEAADGSWTNSCQSPQVPNQLLQKTGYAYKLSPLPTDLSSMQWISALTNSLFWGPVTPPGDITQMYEVAVYVNYSDKSQIKLYPLSAVASAPNPTTTGQIMNPGQTAQFRTWHTSGTGNQPNITFSSWQQIPAGFNNTAQVGKTFSQTVFASGGTAPYVYGIVGGALPPGLSLNPTTGVISGTLGLAGNYTYTVQATDALGATATVVCGIGSACGTVTPTTQQVGNRWV